MTDAIETTGFSWCCAEVYVLLTTSKDVVDLLAVTDKDRKLNLAEIVNVHAEKLLSKKKE